MRACGSILAALFLLSSAAEAGESDTTIFRARLLERGEVRLRYGVSLRSGGQTDSGPGLSYGGMTPNDLELSAGWFPAEHFGAAANVQREAFTLLEQQAKVTSGALLRVSAGPVGRFVIGPLKLQAQVGYAFAQLPSFPSSTEPRLIPGTRHAVLLASRASVALPLGLVAEGRGEYPLALAVTDGAGQAAKATGFAVGGGIAIPVYRASGVEGRLLLDYQYVTDRLTSSDGTTSTQTISRVGGAIAVDLVPPGVAQPTLGSMLVTVVDAESGAPLSEAALAISRGGAPIPKPATSADGKVSLEDLAPGSWIARATAAGYEPSELQTEVRAGQQSTLTLRLHKEAPKVGELVVTVTNKEGGAPIAGASVKIQDQERVTDEQGSVTFAELPPGALSLQVRAAGYRPGEEAAQVVAGRSGTVPVLLFKEKKQIPATISGIVRSVRGPAVKARLEIPELSLRIFADAKGAFSLSVPAGSYRVIISAPHYRKQVKRVSVKEGDQTIFNVDLHPR